VSFGSDLIKAICMNHTINNNYNGVINKFGKLACGVIDGDDSCYKVCEVKNITPCFILAIDIDTTKINRQIWQRVSNK
jgi:hypothetical protein